MRSLSEHYPEQAGSDNQSILEKGRKIPGGIGDRGIRVCLWPSFSLQFETNWQKQLNLQRRESQGLGQNLPSEWLPTRIPI